MTQPRITRITRMEDVGREATTLPPASGWRLKKWDKSGFGEAPRGPSLEIGLIPLFAAT